LLLHAVSALKILVSVVRFRPRAPLASDRQLFSFGFRCSELKAQIMREVKAVPFTFVQQDIF